MDNPNYHQYKQYTESNHLGTWPIENANEHFQGNQHYFDQNTNASQFFPPFPSTPFGDPTGQIPYQEEHPQYIPYGETNGTSSIPVDHFANHQMNYHHHSHGHNQLENQHFSTNLALENNQMTYHQYTAAPYYSSKHFEENQHYFGQNFNAPHCSSSSQPTSFGNPFDVTVHQGYSHLPNSNLMDYQYFGQHPIRENAISTNYSEHQEQYQDTQEQSETDYESDSDVPDEESDQEMNVASEVFQPDRDAAERSQEISESASSSINTTETAQQRYCSNCKKASGCLRRNRDKKWECSACQSYRRRTGNGRPKKLYEVAHEKAEKILQSGQKELACSNCKAVGKKLYKSGRRSESECGACIQYRVRKGEDRPEALWNPPPRKRKNYKVQICTHCNDSTPRVYKRMGSNKHECQACYDYRRRNGQDRPEYLFKIIREKQDEPRESASTLCQTGNTSEDPTELACSNCKAVDKKLYKSGGRTEPECRACIQYRVQTGEDRPEALWNPPPRERNNYKVQICSHCNDSTPRVYKRMGSNKHECQACYDYKRRNGQDRPEYLFKIIREKQDEPRDSASTLCQTEDPTVKICSHCNDSTPRVHKRMRSNKLECRACYDYRRRNGQDRPAYLIRMSREKQDKTKESVSTSCQTDNTSEDPTV